MKFLNIFLESWKIFKNKKILSLIGIEFLFFVLLMIGALVSVNFVTGKVNELKSFQEEFQVNADVSANYIYNNLLLLSGLLNDIIKIAIYFFIFLFLTSGFFMGLQWIMCRNLIAKKKLLHDYSLKYFFSFYLLNLIWFLLFAACFYLLYEFGFDYLWFFIMLVLYFYFMWINFSCLDNKKNVFINLWNGLKLGFLKFYILIPAFLIFFLILFAASYLLDFVNYGFISILISLIGIVIFVWFRIFLIKIIDEIQ